MATSPEILNELFVESLDSPEDRAKLAMSTSSYIRQRMREVSFSRKIMMPQPITKAECQRSVNHDQLVKVVDLEPNSVAMEINFRGAPDSEYIMGERYEIAFYGISSREYQKVEEELLAYEMPLTEIIENNSLKDLHAIEDQGFISRVEDAVALSGKYENSTAYNTNNNELDPMLFVRLFNLLENSSTVGSTSLKNSAGSTIYEHDFDARRYDCSVILMNREDYNKILLWRADDRGNAIAENTTVNGWTYTTIFGKDLIVTNKGELVPPGTMYGFTPKQYMGHAYILGDVKFWIEKKRNLISWSLYEIIGMGIGNAYSMAKVYWTN